MAWQHHGSDTPTSARTVLHHTDPNGPNILKGSVGKQLPNRFFINSAQQIYSKYFLSISLVTPKSGLMKFSNGSGWNNLCYEIQSWVSHISIFMKFKAVGKFFVIFNSVPWWHPRELMKITRAFVSCWPSKRRQQGWQWFLNLWYSIMEKEVGHKARKMPFQNWKWKSSIIRRN